MNRIHLLSEIVANQIAAGEVVERPVSVVKELVENSLDAQATRITVEIQAGGRSLIRVTDDGVGMSRDDALLCLERHATSKILKAEDLNAITTMGFRGEALPSIASVCRFSLTTRERGSTEPEGTQVIINGGKIATVKASGSATGTSIEVRQLFFNVPARRKFLRSEETEFSHIQHYLLVVALAYPEIAFDFLKDTRLIWQLPPVKKDAPITALRERLRALYGADQNLVPVDFSAQLPSIYDENETADDPAKSGFRIWGYIGAPGVSRATREDQHIFVNKRPIDNRGVNFALLEGYHTALMKGRYPVCCLFLEVNPAEVDVNIHPSKREVKFHREKAIRSLVAQAIRETLLKLNNPSLPPQSATAPVVDVAPAVSMEPTSSSNANATEPTTSSEFKLEPATAPTPGFEPAELPNFPKLSRPLPNWPQTPQSTSTLPIATEAGRNMSSIPSVPQNPSFTPQPVTPPAVPLLQVPLRVVGVIGKLYVLLESDRGLVLLDQHAAHERVLFEQMLTRLEKNGTAPSQRLLLPETVELSTRDAHFIREQLPVLSRLGIGLNEFGERTFLLDALPPFVQASNPRAFVLELIDELKASGQNINALRLGEHVIAKTVCRHAVKAHDPLSMQELERLLEELRQCSMPYTCPHGRPTIIEISFRELDKKF